MGPDEVRHDSSYCHHWTGSRRYVAFYVDQLGFAIVSEYDRPERGDILINLRQGQLTLELFIKPTAPERPKLPLPEHAGLRHLAFKWTM